MIRWKPWHVMAVVRLIASHWPHPSQWSQGAGEPPTPTVPPGQWDARHKDREVVMKQSLVDGRRDWPVLPLAEWQATRDTLQLWTQIVGKVRLANEPVTNHWWSVPLYLTASGLTTSLIPHPSGPSFQLDFDLAEDRLRISTTAGGHATVPLTARPVAEFYADVMRSLDELAVGTSIWPMPVELDDAVPFPLDAVHADYDHDQAHRFWLALVEIQRVFELFRSEFLGKASPIHLFWGALDLAVTRFSGRPAPRYPRGAPNCGPHVMAEAYSHEVSSAGYWPGGGGQGLFYSYAYPEPPGYREQPVRPAAARYDAELGEFVLPYDVVQAAPDPTRTLLDFLQSTYEAAADCGEWDRAKLER
jgi:Family of unknown function (DUF5996)